MVAKLTICIPTYNYGAYIGAALDSVLAQITEDVEVIVFDGGSTDLTSDVVRQRQKRFPGLTYYQQGFRGGIDNDIESVVRLARSQYCWLLSADDLLAPQALSRIVNATESQHDVYLCQHQSCDLQGRRVFAYPSPLRRVKHGEEFELGLPASRKRYCELAATTEAFFSFLSSPVFKKDVWDSAKIPASFRGTFWIVAGRLLSAARDGLTLKYIDGAVLTKREGNDSFSNGSYVRRCQIYVESFQHIADEVFGHESDEARHIRRVLRRDFPLRAVLRSKLACADRPTHEDKSLLNKMVRLHYSDPTILNSLKRAIYKTAPVPLIRLGYQLGLWLRTRQGQSS